MTAAPPDPLADPAARLRCVVLEGDAGTRLSPWRDADRARAIADLQADNRFALPDHPGPYALHLSVQDGRLMLDIRGDREQSLLVFGLALGRLRRLIRDYDLLVESYDTARQEGREARIQAIDMGRRGLHNEGAALLQEMLSRRVAVDFNTARRLFTLLCALHQR